MEFSGLTNQPWLCWTGNRKSIWSGHKYTVAIASSYKMGRKFQLSVHQKNEEQKFSIKDLHANIIAAESYFWVLA